MREYTILLDPPVYGAAISSKEKKDLAEAQARALQPPSARKPAVEKPQAMPAPEAQRSIASMPAPAAEVQRSTSSMAATGAQTQAGAPAAEPAPAPAVQPAPAVRTAPATVAPAPAPMVAEDRSVPYDVKYGDTLWSLAKRYRTDDSVSIQRMMLAMLNANPDAFNIQNINALRAGTVLDIPQPSQLGSGDRQAVLAEVDRQHEAWQEYRQSLAGAAPYVPEGTSAPAPGPAPAAAAPEPSTRPVQATAPGASDDGGRLALISGGQGTEGVGSASADPGAGASSQQALNLARETADAKTREADELSSRVADLEGIVVELQRAITC